MKCGIVQFIYASFCNGDNVDCGEIVLMAAEVVSNDTFDAISLTGLFDMLFRHRQS